MHRSQGPWRYHGRRWYARKIIERARALDTLTMRDFSRFAQVQVVKDGAVVTPNDLGLPTRLSLGDAFWLLAFDQRLDSRHPTERERWIMPWEWRRPR